ncbi:hypothetical protein BT96DRAFT_927509 [Gymnopus androsaceus JB14]|uniref:Uncharacterized protein n=1 Tax=Gymnopus androsaceus JB14 TaxID=1447944 RepID=A0A6A4GPG8_9AGAR|nr:hypothetical protein BT96DRAFT_927509 [Gymnopus androsaceus JB14]
MSRAKTHPSLDDPGNNDIDFQISAPPRPPPNPVDPASEDPIAAALTSTSANAPAAPQPSGAVTDLSQTHFTPQEPSSAPL